MADELSSFLDGGKPAPEADPARDNAAADAQPQLEAEGAPVESTPEPDGEAEPPQAQPEPGDTRTVPLAALEGERRQRQDWKDRAARAEAQAAELRKQLEAAAKPPPAAVAAPAPPPRIDPRQDPVGYIQQMEDEQRAERLNQHLNFSEMMLRKELGTETVDALIADFKAAAATDPSLVPKLYSQADPYAWAHKEMERVRLLRELDDPAAYRARIRAEIEAELQGGRAAPAPAGRPASPAAGLMPSLANVRSSAPRSAPAFSGPPPLEDILRRPAARH